MGATCRYLRDKPVLQILQVTVRSFNGCKYFSLGEKCEVQAIEDIGEVADDDLDNGNGGA